MRITPAELGFDRNGTPCSAVYGDVYHSADSGPGQARHVFVEGNGLPHAWAGTRAFTILETGFGLGLNFLATWAEWRDDPARPERLHYVSIEKHPFDRDSLERVHRHYAGLTPLAAQLHAAWPALVRGVHRLYFESERVTLTLAFGEIGEMAPRLRLCADAIYLDGFAPQRNPDMWSPRLMKTLARLAHPGTTVATWSTAGSVRESLQAAGFQLVKRPGFGRKREMLTGCYAPRSPARRAAQAASVPVQRHAIVVGAGLAGAAVSERLAARGWRIDLIDDRKAPAPDAADRFAGVFHPHVSPDDCIRSRLVRNGFLTAVNRWRALQRAGHALAWARSGVLQVAGDADEDQRMAQTIAALAHPADFARHVTRDEAQTLAGCRVHRGGWWFPGGGWMQPSSVIGAQLAAAHASIGAHLGTTVQRIVREDGLWRAFAEDGTVVAAAPVLVLANSSDLTRLAGLGHPLASVRGQVTYLPAAHIAAPRSVVIGSGYVLPAAEGVVVTGSTYDRDERDAAPNLRGHEANLSRLSQLLPDALAAVDASTLAGAVGFRSVTPDRMPLVGAMPDLDAAAANQANLRGAHLADLPRRAGLYCAAGFASRGLIWAALAGEIIGSVLEGEPLPLEADLADAIDPGRFVLKQVRRGRLCAKAREAP
jgi:tRNA 5-methylaminomethyl-2-thiouridine biosynthesis bifunctional protein